MWRTEWLSQKLIVFGVAADPEPEQPFRDLQGQRPLVSADPDRSVFSGFFEM
jgi:hypothetical protein